MGNNTKETWETTYRSDQHISVWPWTDLVAKSKRFGQLHPGARVLELGVGMGANISFFLSEGCAYHGIEASPFAVAKIVQRFPELKGKVVEGDFGLKIPFVEKFDFIFDRGSISHNPIQNVERSMKLVWESLRPGGIYLGIDWYSRNSERSGDGQAHPRDAGCRIDLVSGPYTGIGPMRFFTEPEIKSLLSRFQILHLEEKTSRKCWPEVEPLLASWDVIAKKNTDQ